MFSDILFQTTWTTTGIARTRRSTMRPVSTRRLVASSRRELLSRKPGSSSQSGWSSAKLLLDTYGHFMPQEMDGFEDVLAPRHRNRPEQRHGQTS